MTLDMSVVIYYALIKLGHNKSSQMAFAQSTAQFGRIGCPDWATRAELEGVWTP